MKLWKVLVCIFLGLTHFTESENDKSKQTTEPGHSKIFTTSVSSSGTTKHYFVLLNKKDVYSDNVSLPHDNATWTEFKGNILKYGEIEIPIKNTYLRTGTKGTNPEVQYSFGDIEISKDAKVFETPHMQIPVERIFLRIDKEDIPLRNIPEDVPLSSWVESSSRQVITKRNGDGNQLFRSSNLSKIHTTFNSLNATARQRKIHFEKLCAIKEFLNSTLVLNTNTLKYVLYEVERINRTNVVRDFYRIMYKFLDKAQYREVKKDTLACFEKKLKKLKRVPEEWNQPLNKVTFYLTGDEEIF